MRVASRIGAVAVALGLLPLVAPARAVEPHLVKLAVLGGLGGPLDAGAPDPGLSNRAYQLQLGMFTEPHTLLQLRCGRLDFDHGDRLGDVRSPQLSFATVTGEYRFGRGYYDSGMFLGLGGYRLSGRRGGRQLDDDAIGGVFGVSGEVELNKWLGVLGELALHYADFTAGSKIFGTAQAGLSVSF